MRQQTDLDRQETRPSMSKDGSRNPANIEKFELTKKENPYIPVSTTRILGDFSRDPPPFIHVAELEKRLNLLREYGATVEDLRRWAKNRSNHTVVKVLLRSIFWKSLKVRMPPAPKLYRAIDHYFPPRMEMRVIVCDFGEGRAERREVLLGDIEKELCAKPAWATVRWIHAPLGIGLLHSSVEALFFHSGSKVMGRPFTKAGRAGWPYLETETLDLRDAAFVRDSRDLLRLLKDEREFNPLLLDRSVFAGDNNANLKKDVTWRAQYVGKSLGFWDLAEADLPWQLAEGSHINMNGPSDGIRTTKLQRVSQSVTRHAFFKDAYIARNPFRCFHRDDGFLLTLSPAAGVDYLNTNLPHYLRMSQTELSQDNFASAIGEVYREFAESGTNTWFRKTVEWFMIYLITEVGATPHNIRQGYSVPSLMDALDSVVHELKERRYDRWQRNETINLVRAYLVCIDELTVLEEIVSKKQDFFTRLREDCLALEAQDAEAGILPDSNEGETALSRIAFAEHAMEECSTQCKRLNADLRESLHSLFQLRSIEQNELAIMADNQNKAIFVFTGVTIIFLPLSFFTSYFGMNIKDIQNNNWTEAYFWKVCGSVAFGLVVVIALYAFRYRVRQAVGGIRTKAPYGV
ncbi:hypothetical protein F4780DRAFT_684919 [Xylariomycetidae sp. FL0641]|nr:hypothetical protein F4780DRAFT_684919 [Xylariomycetidae sp. FL0641]